MVIWFWNYILFVCENTTYKFITTNEFLILKLSTKTAEEYLAAKELMFVCLFVCLWLRTWSTANLVPRRLKGRKARLLLYIDQWLVCFFVWSENIGRPTGNLLSQEVLIKKGNREVQIWLPLPLRTNNQSDTFDISY